ncbi:hypothetical protein VZ169_18705 [Acinetobacter baumannii]|uniref:hypothetical protein n=1 Tax=Acinetobacter baumannii TaxID=470 RepID=UPI002936C074|nr:hypothetical protein [Acinetobacter baumannii]MDV2937671.1 hypothetical protein [Acinetobacter baumannii]MDY8133804.1 hypothetical protein [Acinetobacter baumannii]MEA3621005.1 hypothetical protein [Acinetobacter baumannii]MED6088713.1 hypothetical protein [Acinetobacter baumannii]
MQRLFETAFHEILGFSSLVSATRHSIPLYPSLTIASTNCSGLKLGKAVLFIPILLNIPVISSIPHPFKKV